MAGAGSGLAGWIDSRCEGDVGGEGSPRGSVWASALRSGAFAAPAVVSPQPDQLGTRAIAIAAVGSLATRGRGFASVCNPDPASGLGTHLRLSMWRGAVNAVQLRHASTPLKLAR